LQSTLTDIVISLITKIGSEFFFEKFHEIYKHFKVEKSIVHFVLLAGGPHTILVGR